MAVAEVTAMVLVMNLPAEAADQVIVILMSGAAVGDATTDDVVTG